MKSFQYKQCILTFLSLLFFLFQNAYSTSIEISLSKINKEIILNYTRLLLDGKNINNFNFDNEINKIKKPVIISLFSPDGILLISERINNQTLSLQDKLNEAVRNIHHKLKLTKEEYRATYIHIMIVSYTATFANFGIKGLFDWKVYEPRVTGIVYKLKGKSAELNPLECLTWDFNSNESRAYLANKLGIKPKEMIRYNDLKIEIYRVIHFGEGYPNKNLTIYHRGHKLFTTDQVNSATILNSLKWIGYWYKNNVINKEITYIYNPTTDRYENSRRTMVRSTMAVWVLNRLAYFLNDNELKKLGKSCIDYYLKRYFNIDESLKRNRLIPSEHPTERGEIAADRYTTASFITLAILARKDDAYRREIKLLMDWVMQYQKSDGIFWTQFAQSQYFMPGQLLLSIATLYEKRKDKYYKEYFDKSFDVYSEQLDNMMYLGEKWYTPIAPAWFTQPSVIMYKITKENKYRDLVYRINDRVEEWYHMNTRYISYFDYDGMICPKPGSYGNTSITAASLESLVDACYTAKIDGDQRREEKYKNAIKHAVAYLIRLQYLPENTYYIKNRKKVLGGFKYNLISNLIWCDNIWHLTNAFIKILQYKILEN